MQIECALASIVFRPHFFFSIIHHSILTAITFITLDTRGLTSRLDLSHTSTVASLRSSQTRKAKSAAQFVKAESRAPHGFLPITTRLCIGR